MRADGRLGTDYNGGQLDAFRHGVWMAMLVQKMSRREADGLGRAYEKGNYQRFLQGGTEDGAVQDSIASVMDLYNNAVGCRLGVSRKHLTEQTIVEMIVDAVLGGKFQMIRKDQAGHALDRNGRILPNSTWQGKWGNGRCLWRSDFTVGN